MPYDNDLEFESGPYVVLSDGSTFDDALDVEITFLTKTAHKEIFQVQNKGMGHAFTSPGYHFDAADPAEVHTVSLHKILSFYFEHHPEEDPLRQDEIMIWTAVVTVGGKFSRRITYIGSHDPSVAWQDLTKKLLFKDQEAITCLIPGDHKPWAE